MGEAASGMNNSGAASGHPHGGAVVTDEAATYRVPAPEIAAHPNGHHNGRDMSTRELLGRIVQTGSRLVTAEIELAREELKADIEAEISMAKLMAVAGVLALIGLNLLLVAGAFVLALWLPAWLAALVLGAVVLVASAVVGYIGWQRRVTQPLAVTRKAVTEDVQWVKERLS